MRTDNLQTRSVHTLLSRRGLFFSRFFSLLTTTTTTKQTISSLRCHTTRAKTRTRNVQIQCNNIRSVCAVISLSPQRAPNAFLIPAAQVVIVTGEVSFPFPRCPHRRSPNRIPIVSHMPGSADAAAAAAAAVICFSTPRARVCRTTSTRLIDQSYINCTNFKIAIVIYFFLPIVLRIREQKKKKLSGKRVETE